MKQRFSNYLSLTLKTLIMRFSCYVFRRSRPWWKGTCEIKIEKLILTFILFMLLNKCYIFLRFVFSIPDIIFRFPLPLLNAIGICWNILYLHKLWHDRIPNWRTSKFKFAYFKNSINIYVCNLKLNAHLFFI